MSNNEMTLKAYNNHIQEYVERSPQVVDGDLKDWIDSQFSAIPKKAKILEIGSGTGRDARYLESKGYSVERSDASVGFVALLGSQGEEAKLLNILTDEIDSKYDVIFADAVFLHFTTKQLSDVFKKIHHALLPGGSLLFTLKEGDGEEITDRKLGSDRYFRFWRDDDIKNMLFNEGFGGVVEKFENYRKDSPSWLHVSAKKAENEK
jgi:SAM-dependent methyltransferase